MKETWHEACHGHPGHAGSTGWKPVARRPCHVEEPR